MRVEANALRDEIARLEKLSANSEAKKTDMENKLIQEKLKVDNMKRELQKVEENYNEARQNLKEQIEKGNETLQKLEHLENEYNDARKKLREYRKSARKLKQQVTEQQIKIDQDKEQLQKLQKELENKGSEGLEANSLIDSIIALVLASALTIFFLLEQDVVDKEIKLHDLSAQVHELIDKNEELVRSNEGLYDKLYDTKQVRELCEGRDYKFNIIQ